MTGDRAGPVPEGVIAEPGTVQDVGSLLRHLRHRQARREGRTQLTYRALAASTGWAVGVIADYFNGKSLPPPDRFDILIQLLGAAPSEQGALATARDRVDERRRAGAAQRVRAAHRQIPRELPPDVDAFTGRAAELAELDSLLATADKASVRSTAVVISAVSGTAGVGKTALAVHWAHRVAGAFPDGQLYVNLRGYDPGQPMAARDALAGFLRALGMAGQDIPADADERAAAYRTLASGRRMLVLLDNAADVEQVRPLLPGSPSCTVVVTSRDSLAGLVARHGARRIDLDLLPPDEAIGLLRALIGARVDAAPDAAATLAAQCVRLPLALRVAAELALASPDAGLDTLVRDLADEQQRLVALDAGGDTGTAVRGVFSWSYRRLPVEGARAFRLLGLHPGLDCDPYAAAALTDRTSGQASGLLRLLARGHLIHPVRPGRYSMHDLLHAYAADLAAGDHAGDPGIDLDAALGRLLDHYLATAATAMDSLIPAERHLRPRIPAAGTPVPPLAGIAAARAWLDAERANLVAITGYAASHGWPGHAIRLGGTVYRYLETGGHYADAVTIHSHARDAARHVGDRAGETTALTNLGIISWRQGRYEHAASYHQQALAASRESGDLAGEAIALANLGTVYGQKGRDQQAAGCYRQALPLFRETGDRFCEASILANLGPLMERRGRHEEAISHHQRALALFRSTGDRTGEARALPDLGVTYQRQGRYAEAADCFRQALALLRETGDRTGETEALNGAGEILLATGCPEQARGRYTTALTLASQIGSRYEEARAHNGLGAAHQATGNLGLARDHLHHAAVTFADLGLQEADGVRVRLAALGDGTRSAS